MSAQNLALATRFFEEFCNRGSMHLAEELFAAGHTYHDPASQWAGAGPEGMRQFISAYRSAFPDARWNLEESMAAGDRVITRWTAGGTHRNELMGIPATGRSCAVSGIWIHRIANGRIAESWNVWDALGMFQQLGLAPALAQAA